MALTTPPQAQGGSPKLRPELIIIVGGLIASSHASVMITIPAMKSFLDLIGGVWGVSATLAFGVALSVTSAARFFTNIPGGMLSERIGRKPVIIGGALIITVFGTLSGSSPDALWFWGYRFLLGVGSAMTITVANVVATDLSSIQNRGRVLGLMHGMQLVVGIATPALGGFLAELVDTRLPFYLSGAGTGFFALWAILRLPETRPHHVGGSAGADARRPFGAFFLLRDPSFLAVCLLGFSTFFLRGGATTGLIPDYVDEILGYGPGTLGLLFTAASVIHGSIVYPSGWAADKWGRKPVIVPIGIVVGVALVVLPFMRSIAPFTVVFLVLHTAIGWGGQAPTAYLGDISPQGQRGNAFGMYRTFGDAAGIFGPIIALGLADAFNYVVAFTFGAVLWMASLVFFMKVAKESAGPHRIHPLALQERPHVGRPGH